MKNRMTLIVLILGFCVSCSTTNSAKTKRVPAEAPQTEKIEVQGAEDIEPCDKVAQNAVTGTRCRTTGSHSGGYDYFTRAKVAFEEATVLRIKFDETKELGWLDEKSGTIYLDEPKNIDRQKGMSQSEAQKYCKVIVNGMLVRELPAREDFLNFEKHGLRQIIREQLHYKYWSKTADPTKDDEAFFSQSSGDIASTDSQTSYEFSARCIARIKK